MQTINVYIPNFRFVAKIEIDNIFTSCARFVVFIISGFSFLFFLGGGGGYKLTIPIPAAIVQLKTKNLYGGFEIAQIDVESFETAGHQTNGMIN